MRPVCITEPVSHLRLERYALSELPASERAHVQQHLGECPVCRECFAELQASDIAMPPLPAPSALRSRALLPDSASKLRRIGTLGSMLAAAAVALLALRSVLTPEATAPMLPGSSIKGGEIALQLVRERNGQIAHDADSYRSGDRFEVLVTCAPGMPMHWDVIVFQAGETFFPLTPSAPIACGNLVTLPGAFRLTGTKAATVCVALDARAPVDRGGIKRDRQRSLPETTVCAELEPRE